MSAPELQHHTGRGSKAQVTEVTLVSAELCQAAGAPWTHPAFPLHGPEAVPVAVPPSPTSPPGRCVATTPRGCAGHQDLQSQRGTGGKPQCPRAEESVGRRAGRSWDTHPQCYGQFICLSLAHLDGGQPKFSLQLLPLVIDED